MSRQTNNVGKKHPKKFDEQSTTISHYSLYNFKVKLILIYNFFINIYITNLDPKYSPSQNLTIILNVTQIRTQV